MATFLKQNSVKLVWLAGIGVASYVIIALSRQYLPSVDGFFVAQVDWRAASLLAFVETNVLGAVSVAVAAIGIALRKFNQLQSEYQANVNAAQKQSILALDKVQTEKLEAEQKARTAQEMANKVNHDYREQTRMVNEQANHLLVANKRIAELEAELRQIKEAI